MSDFLDELLGDAAPEPKPSSVRTEIPPRPNAGNPRPILLRCLLEKDRGKGAYAKLSKIAGVTDAALQMSIKRKRFSYWQLKAFMYHGNASGHRDAPVWSELEPFCI